MTPDYRPDPEPLPVAAEIAAGQGIYLRAACRRFPAHRGGRPVQLSTVWRWAMRGVRTADGRRVRLEACRLPAGWATSEAAIARFLRALTPNLGEPPPAPRSAGKRARAAERAGQELSRLGI